MLDYGKADVWKWHSLGRHLGKHHPTPKQWPVRLVAVPLGVLAAAAGLEGLAHGWLWYFGYDARAGTFGIAPTLWLLIAGVGFIVVGLIPWERIKGPDKRSKH